MQALAQVHRGVWRDENGTAHDVAIKVLRPGVVEQIAIDLCVLLRASDVFAAWAPRVGCHHHESTGVHY